MIQIQWTSPSVDEARRIIRILLERRLIACANITSPVESHYRWEGALETSQEVKVYLKTMETHFAQVEQTIRQHCSYQVPEIIAFKALHVSDPYQKWVQAETEIKK